MNPRVWSFADLIRANLDPDLSRVGGSLHEAGWDLSVRRLAALRNGAPPARRELDALAWLGLPVQNTPEWLLENAKDPSSEAGV